MHSQKLEIIKRSLESARTWESKGTDSWRNVAWSNKCITSALMNLLSIAVEEFSNQSDAASWLLENGTVPLLRRTHEQIKRLIAEVDAGRVPPSTYGGNYPYLVQAQLAWALGEISFGEHFIAIAERENGSEISTPFWSEYAKGMGSLVRKQEYRVPKMKPRGQEEYWVTYLYLIEAVLNGGSREEALQRIDDAFIARNSDKRIKDDGYEIEGSGTHPVKWDYRRDSLVTYITQVL